MPEMVYLYNNKTWFMYSTEARKLYVIDEVLKTNDDTILSKLEAILETGKTVNKKNNIMDFVGIITNEEAKEMREIIADTCERIDENDWK